MEKTVLESYIETALLKLGIEGRRMYSNDIFEVVAMDDRLREYTVEDAKKWLKSQGPLAKKPLKISELQWLVAQDAVPGFLRVWNIKGLRLEYTLTYEDTPEETNERKADRVIQNKEFGGEDVNLMHGSVPIFLLGLDHAGGEISYIELTLHQKGLQDKYGKERGSERFEKCREIAMCNVEPSTYAEEDAWVRWVLEQEQYNPEKIIEGLVELIK